MNVVSTYLQGTKPWVLSDYSSISNANYLRYRRSEWRCVVSKRSKAPEVTRYLVAGTGPKINKGGVPTEYKGGRGCQSRREHLNG